MTIFYNMASFYYGYSSIYLSAIPFHKIYTIFQIPIDEPIAEGILIGCIPFGGAIGSLTIKLV